jgi:hypothetical protein
MRLVDPRQLDLFADGAHRRRPQQGPGCPGGLCHRTHVVQLGGGGWGQKRGERSGFGSDSSIPGSSISSPMARTVAVLSKGQGVPEDYVIAHMWFSLAAAGGDRNAAKGRDLVATRMTPAQIAEAQKLAREWKPK